MDDECPAPDLDFRALGDGTEVEVSTSEESLVEDEAAPGMSENSSGKKKKCKIFGLTTDCFTDEGELIARRKKRDESQMEENTTTDTTDTNGDEEEGVTRRRIKKMMKKRGQPAAKSPRQMRRYIFTETESDRSTDNEEMDSAPPEDVETSGKKRTREYIDEQGDKGEEKRRKSIIESSENENEEDVPSEAEQQERRKKEKGKLNSSEEENEEEKDLPPAEKEDGSKEDIEEKDQAPEEQQEDEFVQSQFKTIKDEKGRDHVAFKRTGPGVIVMASSQLSASTCQNHMEDLNVIFKILPEAKKKIVFLCVDDGDDWSLRNVTTLHSLGRFLEQQDLFMIGLVKYAPKASRNNAVERVWAPVTKKVAGCILDPENQILHQDVSMTAKPQERINIPFYKGCQNTVAEMLESFQFDGHQWKIGTVDPETQNITVDGIEHIPEFSDQEELRTFYGKTLSKKINTTFTGKEADIRKKAKYYAAHMDLRSHGLFIQRCQDRDCGPCQDYLQKNPLPKDFIQNLNLPTKKDNNANFFVPEDDPGGKDSFKTFLDAESELLNSRMDGEEKKYVPDAELPLQPKSRCQDGCLAVFKDKAPHDRHNNLMHDKNAIGKNLKQRTCRECGMVCASYHYLRRHKAEKHPQLGRGRGGATARGATGGGEMGAGRGAGTSRSTKRRRQDEEGDR